MLLVRADERNGAMMTLATAIGTRSLRVALALTLVLAGGALAQSPWHSLKVPSLGFTVEMPAEPKYSTKPMKTGKGSQYTMHEYLLEAGERAFVIQTSIYPPDVNVANPQTNLQGGLDNAAKNMDGGRWASINWVKHQGITAVDASGRRNKFEIRSYSVLKGRQIFALTYAGPDGSGRSAEVQRFINSLRVQ